MLATLLVIAYLSEGRTWTFDRIQISLSASPPDFRIIILIQNTSDMDDDEATPARYCAQDPATHLNMDTEITVSFSHVYSGKELSSVSSETRITNIDPDGELLLCFEEPSDYEARKMQLLALRVSAKVMKLSSCIFGGMLSPHFREGQTLSQATTTNPKIIHLPEDDFTNMKTICEVVHYQNPAPPDDWLDFADLVERYKMSDAIRHTSEAWLADALHGRAPLRAPKLWYQEHPEILLFAACLLDAPFAFHDASLAFLRCHETRHTDFSPLMESGLPLPYSVPGKLPPISAFVSR